eukprot:359590-Chlamydomonas_euryale.AAC.7
MQQAQHSVQESILEGRNTVVPAKRGARHALPASQHQASNCDQTQAKSQSSEQRDHGVRPPACVPSQHTIAGATGATSPALEKAQAAAHRGKLAHSTTSTPQRPARACNPTRLALPPPHPNTTHHKSSTKHKGVPALPPLLHTKRSSLDGTYGDRSSAARRASERSARSRALGHTGSSPMYRSNSAVDSTQLCTEPSRVLPACATISHTSSPLTPAAGCAAAPVAALFCGCSCSASGANGSESGARASSASQAGSALDSASAPVKGVRLLRREKTMELPRCTWLWSGVSVDAGMEVRERKPMSCCSAGSLAVPPTCAHSKIRVKAGEVGQRGTLEGQRKGDGSSMPR